jgi:parallel beta-helix repeat protein
VEGEVTITILPGTTILFTAHQDDQPPDEQITPVHDEWTAANNDPTISQEYVNSHSKLCVYGTLIARGTPENRIVFTSDSPTPDGGDWEHLHIGYGSIVEYCIVEYSLSAIDVAERTEGSVLISNNIIRHNLWTGITIQHHSSPTITHNEIWDSGGHQGIAVVGEGTAPYIAYNIIRECLSGMNITPGTSPTVEYNTLIDNDSGIGVIGPNTPAVVRYNSISSPNGPSQNWTYRGEPVYFSSILLGRDDAISGISVSDCSPEITNNNISLCNNAGINIMGNSSPTITYNTITDTYRGILIDESFTGSPNIEENNIYDNSYSNISLWSEQSIGVTNNWWGTIDIAEIQAKILDMRGQPVLELVTFEPFLTELVDIE